MEIEKPWCVYGALCGVDGFGKIMNDYDGVVHIISSEKQQESGIPWDSSQVKRFSTLEEAVDEYIQKGINKNLREHWVSEDIVWEWARRDFPNYFKEKK